MISYGSSNNYYNCKLVMVHHNLAFGLAILMYCIAFAMLYVD